MCLKKESTRLWWWRFFNVQSPKLNPKLNSLLIIPTETTNLIKMSVSEIRDFVRSSQRFHTEKRVDKARFLFSGFCIMGFQIKRLLRTKNKNSGVAFKSESSVASKCYGQLCMYSDSKILINTVTFWRQWDKKKLHAPQTLPQNFSGWWECFIHTKMIAWTQKSGGERLLLSVSFRELRRLSFYYAPKISLAQGNNIIFRAWVKVTPTIQNQHWLKKMIWIVWIMVWISFCSNFVIFIENKLKKYVREKKYLGVIHCGAVGVLLSSKTYTYEWIFLHFAH